jgi:N-acyl-D-aspartate/D-glutamate deacylase
VDNSVAAVARGESRDPWEVVYDAMLGSDGRDFLLFPLLNYGKGSYDGLYDLMSDPLTVQGLGDGGAHSSIVCDASMTTYLLTTGPGTASGDHGCRSNTRCVGRRTTELSTMDWPTAAFFAKGCAPTST